MGAACIVSHRRPHRSLPFCRTMRAGAAPPPYVAHRQADAPSVKKLAPIPTRSRIALAVVRDAIAPGARAGRPAPRPHPNAVGGRPLTCAGRPRGTPAAARGSRAAVSATAVTIVPGTSVYAVDNSNYLELLR